MSLILELDAAPAYEPGERIAGVASWDLGRAAVDLALCLLWRSGPPGSAPEAIAIVWRRDWTARGQGSERFAISAPAQPWSCRGRLLAIAWRLELVPLGRGARRRPGAALDLLIAPGRQEQSLGCVGQAYPPI